MEHREQAGAAAAPLPAPVAYQGVWVRTLLETPAGRDTSAWVRWVQTARWHGALGRSGVATALCEPGPGAEHSVFQTPDRVVQTGVLDRHLAVWERLPDSRGRRIALARRDTADQPTNELLLVCGNYVLHRGDSARSVATLFGHLDTCRGLCHIERASDATLDDTTCPWHLQRLGMDLARIEGTGLLDGAWEVLEWTDG